jgi:hypothetical protein
MRKLFEKPAQYRRCNSNDGGSSRSDKSANCGDHVSLLQQLSILQQFSLSAGPSAYCNVQRNPAHRREEATQVKNESESPPPGIVWNAFPNEQMAQLPVSPIDTTRIHQEEIPSIDIGGRSKISKYGIAPRIRAPHQVSRSGDLQHGRKPTHPLLRVNKSVAVATLGGALQKRVQPEAPKAIPPLPLKSQQDMGRDDSKKATEAKVGFRRRQSARPLLRESSSRRKMVPPAA